MVRIGIGLFILAAFFILAGGLMVPTGISDSEGRLFGITFSLGVACGVLGVLLVVIGAGLDAIRKSKAPDNSSH
jgi:hypothetical protein